jgi:hypothetical protein
MFKTVPTIPVMLLAMTLVLPFQSAHATELTGRDREARTCR